MPGGLRVVAPTLRDESRFWRKVPPLAHQPADESPETAVRARPARFGSRHLSKHAPLLNFVFTALAVVAFALAVRSNQPEEASE